MPLWVSSISSISLVVLIFVLICERGKNGTLNTLLAGNLELARARDSAEAANRSKSDFLANVSHEIRTPLTAILGYAELLLRGSEAGAIPSAYASTLNTIRRNGEHLLDIINDILDLSKIAAGRFDVERVPVAPVALVSDVVGLMSIRARAKGLTLSVECESPLPEQFETDPRRLRQVLVNLIGNALKFTEAGRVVLRVSPQLRGDTAATRTAGVVAGFSLVPIAFVPLLALVGWFAFPREVAWRIVALELGAVPVCATVPLVLRITGSTRVAGNFMLAYAFLLFGLVTYYAGGMISPPSFWNVLIPMTAVALVGRRWAWFWTGAVLAEGVAVVWLERSGFQFTNHILRAWRPLYWFASIASLASLIMLAGLGY